MKTMTVVGVFTFLVFPFTQQDSESVQKKVLAAEDARFAAMVRADTAALTGMLGDDLLYVHSSGRTETKAQFLNAIESRSIRYIFFVPLERRATILDPSAAVIMGRDSARVIFGGQELTFVVRHVGVYTLSGERWQLRAWQTTRLAQ